MNRTFYSFSRLYIFRDVFQSRWQGLQRRKIAGNNSSKIPVKLALLSTFLTTALMLNGCDSITTFPGESLNLTERLAYFDGESAPVTRPVAIYWDEHAIPFIEADNNADLAFAIGAVHAHLRIDQLEIFRRISQGRLSEMAGPIPQVNELDQALRMLDFMGSAENAIPKMHAESRQWMEQFTQGINWYIKQLPEQPVTNKFISQRLKPYTLAEVIAITRLVTADLTWAAYFKYLKYAEDGRWKEVLDLALGKIKTDSASYQNPSDHGLSQLLKAYSRSGSNSLVIGGQKTPSGAAMIASDPHVGLTLPNFWVLVGIKSPDYHAFGLMIPGVPIIGVGRNPDIAWGGTNMRGISSHLYDVSQLPEREISTRQETIQRRWWFDKTVTIRETDFGPIISDLPMFEGKLPFDVALNWIGRSGTDEIYNFLQVAKAKNWQEFSSAFADYQVSAMNMLYADAKGNIGMVAAYGQPVLKKPEKTLDLLKQPDNPVVTVLSPTLHPNPYNPSSGYIASANNKPFANTAIPFSFGYANNDRFERLQQLTQNKDQVQLDDLKQFQQDVFSSKAFKLKQLLLQKIATDAALLREPLMQSLRQWNGEYASDSAGAVVFYALMNHIWQHYLQQFPEQSDIRKELEFHENWKASLLRWLPEQHPESIANLVRSKLTAVAEITTQHPTWGTFTIQTQKTMLGMIPVIGSRFSLPDYPSNGGNDTINKYGRKFSLEKAHIHYGASARHISDLSSLDENYFVLHGGQDAWMMNDNLADQTQLWRKGQYIKIPLSMPKVKQQFSAATTWLKPAAKVNE